MTAGMKDDTKKAMRQIRNRKSAQESRDKKRQYVETLEQANVELKSENDELRKRLKRIEDDHVFLMDKLKDIQVLKNTIDDHDSETTLHSSSTEIDKSDESAALVSPKDLSDQLNGHPSNLHGLAPVFFCPFVSFGISPPQSEINLRKSLKRCHVSHLYLSIPLSAIHTAKMPFSRNPAFLFLRHLMAAILVRSRMIFLLILLFYRIQYGQLKA